MRVLVATTKTQGWRATDACGALDGELVRFPILRDADELRHAFEGLETHAFSTTALILERADLTMRQYVDLLIEDFERHRSIRIGHELRMAIALEAAELTRTAATGEVGAIVERDLDLLCERRLESDGSRLLADWDVERRRLALPPSFPGH